MKATVKETGLWICDRCGEEYTFEVDGHGDAKGPCNGHMVKQSD